jgi:hypothetical protein
MVGQRPSPVTSQIRPLTTVQPGAGYPRNSGVGRRVRDRRWPNLAAHETGFRTGVGCTQRNPRRWRLHAARLRDHRQSVGTQMLRLLAAQQWVS